MLNVGGRVFELSNINADVFTTSGVNSLDRLYIIIRLKARLTILLTFQQIKRAKNGASITVGKPITTTASPLDAPSVSPSSNARRSVVIANRNEERRRFPLNVQSFYAFGDRSSRLVVCSEGMFFWRPFLF